MRPRKLPSLPSGFSHQLGKNTLNDEEVFKDLGVSRIPDTDSPGGYRLLVPVRSLKDALVGYARFSVELPFTMPDWRLSPKRAEDEVFNLNEAVKEVTARPLIITQDPFDVMWLYQCGYRHVAAIMHYNNMSNVQEERIRSVLKSHPCVLLMIRGIKDSFDQEVQEKMAARLSKFAFTKIYKFSKPGIQAKDLTSKEIEKALRFGF